MHYKFHLHKADQCEHPKHIIKEKETTNYIIGDVIPEWYRSQNCSLFNRDGKCPVFKSTQLLSAADISNQ